MQVVSLKVNKINYLILSLGQPKFNWLGKVALNVTSLNLLLAEFMNSRKGDRLPATSSFVTSQLCKAFFMKSGQVTNHSDANPTTRPIKVNHLYEATNHSEALPTNRPITVKHLLTPTNHIKAPSHNMTNHIKHPHYWTTIFTDWMCTLL